MHAFFTEIMCKKWREPHFFHFFSGLFSEKDRCLEEAFLLQMVFFSRRGQCVVCLSLPFGTAWQTQCCLWSDDSSQHKPLVEIFLLSSLYLWLHMFKLSFREIPSCSWHALRGTVLYQTSSGRATRWTRSIIILTHMKVLFIMTPLPCFCLSSPLMRH